MDGEGGWQMGDFTQRKFLLVLGLIILGLSFGGLKLYQNYEQQQAIIEQARIQKGQEEARAKQEEERRRAEEERRRAETIRREAAIAEKQRIEQQRKYEAEAARRKEEAEKMEAERREKERQERTVKFTHRIPAGQLHPIPLCVVYKNDIVHIKVRRIGQKADGKVYLAFQSQVDSGTMSFQNGRWVYNGVFPINDDDQLVVGQQGFSYANYENENGVVVMGTTNIINYYDEMGRNNTQAAEKLNAFQQNFRDSYYDIEIIIEGNNPWNKISTRISR
jgi:hypothetical protein